MLSKEHQHRNNKCGTNSITDTYSYILLIGSWLFLSFSSHAIEYVAGDIGPYGAPDGQLNVADIVILQRIIIGDLIPTEQERLIADVAPLGSPDGVLNVADVTVLMRAIHGYISLPPVVVGLDAPVLDDLPATTNDNPLIVTGTAGANETIRLYVGTSLFATTSAQPDGSFQFPVSLDVGVYSFSARVWDGETESPSSNQIIVEYQTAVPILNDIPATTTSNGITVTGTIGNDWQIKLFVNGVQTQMTTASGGTFSFNNIILSAGLNTIYAIANDGFSDSGQSVEVTTTYDLLAPTISDAGNLANANPFRINGTAPAYSVVYIYVNDQKILEVTANGSGDFSTNVYLFDGANTIHTTTWDGYIESSQSNLLPANYTSSISKIINDSTYDGTDISQNIVLTPDSSGDPYVLTGEAVLQAGYEIVIMPGTRVEVVANSSAPYEFGINGVLKVLGTKDNPVVFTVQGAVKNAGDWKGIGIHESPYQNIIQYARIEYAETGIHAFGANLTLQDNTISNASVHGIYAEGSNVTVQDNIIEYINEGIHLVGSDGSIRDNTISNASAHGIYAQNSDITVQGNIIEDIYEGMHLIGSDGSIRDNTIRNVAYIAIYVEGSNVTVQDNIIEDALYGVYLYNSDGNIQNNTIKNTNGNAQFAVYLYDSDGNIQNNTIENTREGVHFYNSYGSIQNNTIRYIETEGVYVESNSVVNIQNNIITDFERYGIFAKTGVTGDIKGNTIDQVNGIPVDGLIVYGVRAGIYSYNVNLNIENNVITRSYTNIVISGGSPTVSGNYLTNAETGLWVIGDAAPVISDNQMMGNGVGIWLTGGNNDNPVPNINGNSIVSLDLNINSENFVNAAGTSIDATGNWWGNTDPLVISEMIYDYTDNPASSPVINVLPFLNSMPAWEGIDEALTGANVLPMLLTGTTVLSGVTYIISPVTVPVDATLIFAPGSVVYVKSGASLTINGSLEVQGLATDKVTFTSTESSPAKDDWEGIVINSSATGVIIDHAIIEYANRGVYFNNATGSISNSYIQHNTYGVYMSGASNSSLMDNVLINNTYGIYLQGGGNDASNPQPIINNNDIYNNTMAQVYMDNYGTSSAVNIDLTSNWWGTDTPTTGIGGEIQYGNNMPADSNALINISTPLVSPGQGPGMLSMGVSEQHFSPNGDNRKDIVIFAGTLTEIADWTVIIKDAVGSIVKTFSGSGTDITVIWDGRNEGSVIQPDGLYLIGVIVTTGGRASQSGYEYVEIDTIAPDGVTISISEPPFINYTDVTLSLTANDVTEMIVSELSNYSDAAWEAFSLSKTITLSATEGTHTVYVKYRDPAGNETPVTDTVVLDMSPPNIIITYPDSGAIFQ